MKLLIGIFVILSGSSICLRVDAQNANSTREVAGTGGKHFYIDVHQLTPGKVKFEDVAGAHAKDLATQAKYNAHFLKYWVDEKQGLVYCLSSADDSAAVRRTHADAHGLLPTHIYEVIGDIETAYKGKDPLFLDIHQVGPGKVTAKDVAAAHKEDLAVQHKHGLELVNYWFDEKNGVIFCLSHAKDSSAIIKTHREAHGLVPTQILRVKEGQ